MLRTTISMALSRLVSNSIVRSSALPIARFCTQALSNANTIDTSKFRKWCSAFGELEETALKVKYNVTNDIKDLGFPVLANCTVPSQLLLSGISQDMLIAGSSENLPEPKDDSKAFVRIIRDVLVNNYVDTESPKDEVRIDMLAGKMLDRLAFDRAGLYTRPKPNLDLEVGSLLFASRCDFIIGLEDYIDLRVAIVEDKHLLSSHYRKGLFQAVCSMIAAAQRYTITREVIPMYGIRIVGDCFTFLYCEIPWAYMNAVKEGVLPEAITVHCYPPEAADKVAGKNQTRWGLRYSVPADRAAILNILANIREKVVVH